jgi:cell division protein FtsW
VSVSRLFSIRGSIRSIPGISLFRPGSR